MKKLTAIALASVLLTGCSTTSPDPAPTTTLTLQECATEAFAAIKKELGVKFLVDEKDKANAMVRDTCKGLPMGSKE
jgi:uncharacterized protein YcfL